MEIWPILHFFFLAGTRHTKIFERKKIFTLRIIWILNFLVKKGLKVFLLKRIFFKKNPNQERVYKEDENLKFESFIKEILAHLFAGSWFVNFLYIKLLRAIFIFFHSKRMELFPLSI